MGGRAFSQTLSLQSFPKLPAPLYTTLKARLKATLETLFAIVEVPPERPGKEFYGDVDLVVACPRHNVTSDQVGQVLGAIESIKLDGNRISNYAIAIPEEDWLTHAGKPCPADSLYCQVDVRVCADEQEVEGVTVFHGYGDLGIIITAIAKSHGLSVNYHGLKVPSPHPDPPVHLTRSPRAVFDFMGLSMDRWLKGFKTAEEIFEFAATSRLFDPRRLRVPSMETFNKNANHRIMYFDFLTWAQNKTPARSMPQNAVEEALVAFGKKSERDALLQERHARVWVKANFNGKLVAEWTGLGWRGVKAVMDNVRSSVGGERALVDTELVQVKDLVLKSQQSLKLAAQ